MFRLFKQFFQFIYWKGYDFKHPKKKSPYGIYCYVGRPGFGKTLSMVEKLHTLKKEFPNAQIYTNFAFDGEDGSIDTQDDLVNYNNGTDGVIFAVDELQNTFNNRNYQKFPLEMLSLITQNRKKSKMILCTAQSFDMIDINFRRICNLIIECRNLGGRWFFQRAFYPDNYKETDGVYTPRRRVWRYSFIAKNELFNCYNTLLVIEKLMKGREGGDGVDPELDPLT